MAKTTSAKRAFSGIDMGGFVRSLKGLPGQAGRIPDKLAHALERKGVSRKYSKALVYAGLALALAGTFAGGYSIYQNSSNGGEYLDPGIQYRDFPIDDLSGDVADSCTILNGYMQDRQATIDLLNARSESGGRLLSAYPFNGTTALPSDSCTRLNTYFLEADKYGAILSGQTDPITFNQTVSPETLAFFNAGEIGKTTQGCLQDVRQAVDFSALPGLGPEMQDLIDSSRFLVSEADSALRKAPELQKYEITQSEILASLGAKREAIAALTAERDVQKTEYDAAVSERAAVESQYLNGTFLEKIPAFFQRGWMDNFTIPAEARDVAEAQAELDSAQYAYDMQAVDYMRAGLMATDLAQNIFLGMTPLAEGNEKIGESEAVALRAYSGTQVIPFLSGQNNKFDSAIQLLGCSP